MPPSAVTAEPGRRAGLLGLLRLLSYHAARLTLLLTTLALMQRAVVLSFENWSYAHVWIHLPIFYFGAAALVGRRYDHE